MTTLKIVISSLEDAKAGKPIVEGLKKEDIVETNDLTVGILEGGMSSGETSIMFLSKTPDGKTVVSQTSKALLEQVYAAILGAEQRWESEKRTR